MINAYAIGCSEKHLEIVDKGFKEGLTLKSVDAEGLLQTDTHPDLVLLKWDGSDDSSDELARMIDRVKGLASDREIPILVVMDSGDLEAALEARSEFAEQAQAIAESAAQEAGAESQDLLRDARFINPFIQATLQVISTMAHKQVERGQFFMKQEQVMYGDVTGVVGVTGKGMDGTVAISFPKELAGNLIANMLGMEPETADLSKEELHDGVGELVNMISGRAKADLSAQKGTVFQLSIPTIVSGEGHEIGHRPGTPCLVIFFDVEGQSFAVQIAFSSN